MPKIIAKKEDWIKLGYQLFTEQGEHGIVVDRMAKEINCNRSSFYWHFKTKKSFIQEIVNYWVSLETKNIIDLIDRKNSPKERFHTLVALSFKKNLYLDFVFYLKRYALKDKEARDAMHSIDLLRKGYVSDILMALGFSEEEAKNKSLLLYKYLIGYHETIRYKKQSENYIAEILKEMKCFINIEDVSV